MAFVSYDSYKNRIEKLAKFKNFVDKYKFLIMGVLAVILGGAAALMATKGMITTDIALSADTYTYGDSYTPTAGTAFLSDVGYEYSVQGSDEWTDKKPVKVGKYSVRAVSNKLIGKGYGTPVNYEILPAKINFEFKTNKTTSLVYGSKPAKSDYEYTGLVSSLGDTVNDIEFDYDYPDKVGEDVAVTLKTLDITGGGEDRSDCYEYDKPSANYTFEAKTVSFKIANVSETYNGKGFTVNGTPDENSKKQLVGSDKYDLTTQIAGGVTPKNWGDYAIELDTLKVLGENDKDITYRYNFSSKSNGTFTVEKRKVTVLSETEEWIYDGETHSNANYKITSGTVAEEQTLTATSNVSVTDVRDGIKPNELTYEILDSSNAPVTENYIITSNTGTLKITPRALTITTAGGEWEYDGTAHPVKEHTASGLAEGQELKLVQKNGITYASEAFTDVIHSGKNALNYSIVWGQSGAEVDINNYNVTENYGYIKITPIPLRVLTEDGSKPYDGTPLSVETYTVFYAGTQPGGTGSMSLDLSIVGNVPQIINVGTKENAINFAVPNSNYYIKETVNGTLTVTQAEITITLDNAECDYGDTLPAPDITISGSGIVGGKLFGGDTLKPAFKYLKDGATPAAYEAGKTYDISLDTVNSKFTYGNGEPVTTPNYKITSNTSTLTVGTRAITVYLNDTTLTYGNALIYDLGGEKVEGIVAEQTVVVDASKVKFTTPLAMPDAGTYDGAISCPTTAISVLSGTTPVTSNYAVTVEVSTLYISQREITVKAKDMLGVIYGEEISYEVKEGNYANAPDLVSGEKLTVNNVIYGYNQGETPIVGTYTIKPDVNQITILKSDGTTPSRSNYKITPENGTLEIVKRPVRIESGTNRDLIYDGTAQYDKSFEVLLDNPKYYDKLSVHEIVVTDWTTVTDVAPAVQNRHGYDIVDQSGTSVKGNYEVYTSSGYLLVNPKPITVQLNNYEAVYGESYAYKTGAGNYENTPDLAIGETLEVTKVSYEFGFVATPNVREAAYWVKAGTFKVTKSNGALSTDNYEITPVDGSLKINKRHIEVTLKSDTAIYGNGYAYPIAPSNYLKAELLDLETGNALVSGETLKITAVTYEYGTEQYPEVREGGYWIRQADYEITKGGSVDSKGNYYVEFVDGTLTITPRTAIVALNDIASVKYGEEVEYAGGYKTKSGVLNIHTVTVNAAAGDMSFTPDADSATYAYPDAGTYAFTCNESLISITDASGKDAKHNYTVNVAKGGLEIEKRAITVKPYSYEREYGKIYNYSTIKLIPNYADITKGTLAVIDGAKETLVIFVDSLEFDGYVKKDVGKYDFTPNRYTVTRYDGHDSTNNYKVDYETGTLTITKKAIEVELPYFTTLYGDDEYKGKHYSELYAEQITMEELPFGELLQFAIGFTQNGKEAEPKKVGFYDVVISKEEIKHSNGTVTENGNYSITYTGRKLLQITTRQIQILPHFVSVIYGDEIAYPSGRTNFTYEKLTSDPKVDIKINLPKYGEEIEIAVKYALDGKNPPSVGKYDAVPDKATVYYKDGTSTTKTLDSENTGYYFFEVDGYWIMCPKPNFKEKLEITPKELTVTLNNINVEYGDEIEYVSDGNEKAEGLLTEFDHKLDINPSGIIFAQNGVIVDPQNVGKYDFVIVNKKFITVSSGDDDVTSNYDIKVAEGGVLVISARKIVLTLQDMDDIVYGTKAPVPVITGTVNGDIVTNSEFIYDNIDNLTTSSYFETKWLNGGENRYLDAGTYHVAIKSGIITFQYANGAPASTKNYDVQAVLYANLKVTPRPITVELKPFKLVYGQKNSSSLCWSSSHIASEHVSLDKDMDISELISIDNLAAGEGVYWLGLDVYKSGVLVPCKDAGEYEIGLNRLSFRYGNGTDQGITKNYEYDLPANTTLEITKYNLSPLDVSNKRAVYGSAASTLASWEFTRRAGLPFNEILKVSSFALKDVNLQETTADVGTYPLDPNVFTATVLDGSADNYEITIEGNLIIVQRELTVNLYDNEAYYGEDYGYLNIRNGAYIDASGLVTFNDRTETLEITLVDYGFNGVRPNASQVAYAVQKFECTITKVDGVTPGTGNYNIKFTGGNLTVNKRPVTVTLLSVEDIIYGEDLPMPEYVIKYGEKEGLVGSDKFHPEYLWRASDGNNYYGYSYEPLRGNVGEYGIILYQAFSYFTDAADTKVENYDIVSDSLENEVILNITPRPITITLKSFEIDYGGINGTAIHWHDSKTPSTSHVTGDVEEYIVLSENGLAEGEEIRELCWRSPNSETGNYITMKNVGVYNLELLVIVAKSSDGGFDYIKVFNQNRQTNYDLTLEGTATLTINPKEVTLDLGNLNFTYGEEEDFRAGYEFTSEVGKLAFDETLTLKTFYALDNDGNPITDRLNAGNYTVSADQASADFSDEYGQTNYEVTFTGTLTVEKREIEIELWDIDSVTYGEKLEYPVGLNKFDILSGNFVYGQQLKVLVLWDGSIVNSGNFWWGNAGIHTYRMSRGLSGVYESDGVTYVDADNYSFTCADKEVEIKPFEVTITPDSDTKVYDGTAYEYDTTSFSRDKDLPLDESLVISVKYEDENGKTVSSPTDAGTYKIYLDAITVIPGTNEDAVPENYELTNDETVYGTLKITKREITVGVVENQKFVYGVEDVSPKFTAIGFPQEGVDAGKIHALLPAWEYSVDGEEWLDGDDLWLNGITLDTGVYFVRCKNAIVTYDNHAHYDPIEKNHEVTYQIGTFEVIAREVRLVTNTRTDFIYNGEYQFDNGYTLYYKNSEEVWTEFTLPDDATVILGEYTKIKDADTVENEVELTIPNYDIVEREWGTLTVNKREIVVESATNHNFVYDGEEHSDSGCWAQNLVIGHSISSYNVATVTFVTEGEVVNAQDYIIYDAYGQDVTANYDIVERKYGTLKVNPRTIKLQSNGNSWFYDGDDHDDRGFTQLFGDGLYTLVDGHEITVTDYTSILTVMQGEVDNDLEYAVVDVAGTDFTLNYEIKKDVGKLKIKPVEITIALNDLEVTYGDDLYPATPNNYDVANSDALVGSEQLQVAVKYKDGSGAILAADPVNAGEYVIILNLAGCYVETAYGENGIGNYTIVNADDVEATLTIKPREITVQLDPMTKQYGEAFDGSNAGYQLVSGEIVNNDDIKVTVYCPDCDIDEKTPAGNEYTLAIESCAVNGVHNIAINDTPNLIHAWNYDITYVESKLTVTAREIVVVAASAEKEGYYDGTPFSCDKYERAYFEGDPEVDGIMPWDDIEDILEYVENSANSVINAGDFDNEAQFTSKSNNYTVVRTEAGTLTIKQRPITINLKEISDQTYGTRLTYPDGATEPNFTYADGSLEVVGDEKLTIAVVFYDSDGDEADPKNADTYSYEFYLDGSTVSDSIGGAGIANYVITCDDTSYATVHKLEVTLTLQDWASIFYDGDEHEYDAGITYAFPYGETMQFEVDYYSVTDEVETALGGKPKNAGDYVAKYDEANSRIGGVAPDVNYEINLSPEGGISFTIKPLNITISMGEETYTYDGKVYDYTAKKQNFGVSEEVSGETIVPHVSYYADEELTVSATPKNAGTYFVKFEYFTVEGSNDVAENYNLLNTEASCKLTIERREIEIQAVLDGNDFCSIERFDDLPVEGFEHFTFVEEDLAQLTPVYSYGYLGEDGTSESQPVDKEDVNQTIGIYEVSVEFTEKAEGGNVLGNYKITDNLPATLEVTARKVTVEAVYNGDERQYNGEALDKNDFGFIHWHGDDKSQLGFYDDFVAEYDLVFTKDGVESTDLPVNAGTYTVNIKFKNVDKTVYAVSDSDTEVTVTILKRVLVATVHYDASQYEDITYNYGLLPTSSVSVTNTDENGDIGILAIDTGVEIEWFFYNHTMGKEVEYNYAGEDEIKFRIKGDADDNYELLTEESGETFTVKQVKIYVTPVGVTADYDEAGKTLKLTQYLIWDKDGNETELYGSDELTITGTAENRNQRYLDVGIKSVSIKQGELDVTHCYEVHHKYEEGSPVPENYFKARLAFNPVIIKYKQTSLNGGEPLMLPYTGKAYDLSKYGVDKSNLAQYIEITDGTFVGSCTFKYTLMPVSFAREYEKWIQIRVFDNKGLDVTGLYSFQLQNADESKVVVYGDYLDFNLDEGCDFTDVTESTLYKGYFVLNSGYTLTGLTDETHKSEVLLKDGVLYVIVYKDGTKGRVEASTTYSIRPAEGVTVRVKLTQMAQILASTTIN